MYSLQATEYRIHCDVCNKFYKDPNPPISNRKPT